MAKKRKKQTRSSAPATKAALQIGRHIWPVERDVLFRPDRLKYVRKLIIPQGCVFCQAAENGISFESLCVYQTEHSMVILNKFPYNTGHVLVLPRRHCGKLEELSDEEYMDMMKLLRITYQAIQEIYQPSGGNIGLNQGAVAGAGIPDHMHFHLIPRWAGDVNFFPLIAETKVLIENLETTFDRLLRWFQTLASRTK